MSGIKPISQSFEAENEQYLLRIDKENDMVERSNMSSRSHEGVSVGMRCARLIVLLALLVVIPSQVWGDDSGAGSDAGAAAPGAAVPAEEQNTNETTTVSSVGNPDSSSLEGDGVDEGSSGQSSSDVNAGNGASDSNHSENAMVPGTSDLDTGDGVGAVSGEKEEGDAGLTGPDNPSDSENPANQDDPANPSEPGGSDAPSSPQDVWHYKVVFDGNGATGGEMEDQEFTYGVPQALTPNAYMRLGYRFVFWVDGRWDWLSDLLDELMPQAIAGVYFDNETVVDLTPEVDGEFVLHAVWRELTHVTISYQADRYEAGTVSLGSERINPESGTAQGSTAEAAAGYRFVNWTDDEEQVVSESEVFTPEKEDGLYEEAAYTANFETIPYTITYNLDGGTLAQANPASYTVEDSFILNRPTKEGYVFQGWTGSGLSLPTKSAAVRKGSTGDRTYTATWVKRIAPKSLTLNFDFSSYLGGLAKTGDRILIASLGAIILLGILLLGLSRIGRGKKEANRRSKDGSARGGQHERDKKRKRDEKNKRDGKHRRDEKRKKTRSGTHRDSR